MAAKNIKSYAAPAFCTSLLYVYVLPPSGASMSSASFSVQLFAQYITCLTSAVKGDKCVCICTRATHERVHQASKQARQAYMYVQYFSTRHLTYDLNSAINSPFGEIN